MSANIKYYWNLESPSASRPNNWRWGISDSLKCSRCPVGLACGCGSISFFKACINIKATVLPDPSAAGLQGQNLNLDCGECVYVCECLFAEVYALFSLSALSLE